MIQLTLQFPRSWHEARVAEAEKRCLDAIKGHKERKSKYEKAKHWRTVQLRQEVYGMVGKQAA